MKLITTVAKNIENLPGPAVQGGREDAIPAMCFAAADKNIGWVRESIDAQGRNVHRFILLFTDIFSIFKLDKPGNRTKFRGDGTDTCQTSLPPNPDAAGRILKENNMIVIGAYVGIKQSSLNEFKQFFKKYGIPHIAQTFKNADDLKKELVGFISNSIRAHLQCVFGDPPGFNTLGF